MGLSGSGKYKLEYGLVPNGPDEIALLTRSALEILFTSASYFDVPEAHLRQGRAAPRAAPPSDTRAPIIRVRHSCDRPPCAYVAVFNRGHWFWIDDSDVRSKRTFSFIEVLLNITDTGEKGHGPVVSIGN